MVAVNILPLYSEDLEVRGITALSNNEGTDRYQRSCVFRNSDNIADCERNSSLHHETAIFTLNHLVPIIHSSLLEVKSVVEHNYCGG